MSMPILVESVISAILEFTISSFITRLERNEIVVKLLKRFNFNPQQPPADFDSIYIYSLLEYGPRKPRPVLKLFQKEKIKEAFHQAFEKQDPTILLEEGKNYLDWNVLGDEFRDLGIDLRRELLSFCVVFNEVTDHARTPVEVKQDNQLGDIQKSLDEIIIRLDSFKDLDQIRGVIKC